VADKNLIPSVVFSSRSRRISPAISLFTVLAASIAATQIQLPAAGAATSGDGQPLAAIAAETMMPERTVTTSRSGNRELVENDADVYYETVTETEPFEHIEQQDPNRFADLPPRVVQAGVTGEVTRVYQYTDSSSSDGIPVLEVVTAERQDEIVAIGTRERPAAAISVDVPGSVWDALAQCESGGRPNAVSANGLYHGLFQFSVGTWHSVGGEGLPSEASPEEQLARAQQLQARSGWGQWPHCSKKIGVR